MQHRPLVGQVLPGRQPGRVVARPPAPFVSALLLNTAATLVSVVDHDVTGRRAGRGPTSSVRGPGRRRRTCERMVSNDVEALARARLVRGAAAHREGARDRSADRAAARRRRLPAPDRARAGRAASAATLLRCRFAAKCAIEAEQHVSMLVLGAEAELVLINQLARVPNLDYGLPAYELLDAVPPHGAEPIEADELERLRIRRAHARSGSRSTSASCPRRPVSRSARSASRRAATRGRSRSRGSTTAATRTAGCASSRSTATAPPDVRHGADARREDGRPRHERGLGPRHGVLALAYVRREVPDDAVLTAGLGVRHTARLSSPRP